MSFIRDVYRLKCIVRYSNIPRIKDETVAEHGFFVAAIVMELHSRYEFDLGLALKMAIAHDIPEMELNDCPHIIKKKYPAIKAAYNECEKQVASTLPAAVREGVEGYDSQSSIEASIVHLADIIQCIQYSGMEVQLGNRGYMEKVYKESLDREQQLIKEIKQYERHKD